MCGWPFLLLTGFVSVSVSILYRWALYLIGHVNQSLMPDMAVAGSHPNPVSYEVNHNPIWGGPILDAENGAICS
jgi:hypothetical protein